MNNKVVNFIKNFSYALSSNLVTLLISTLIVLIVPKLIGVEEYGYFQLYIFYSSYVGFLHFGWNDGIYLRYGGKEYKDLNKKLFFSQFVMLGIFQFIIAGIIFFLSFYYIQDSNKIFIIQMTSLCLLFVNIRYMLLYILQATNRIKDYARSTMIDKIIYCCLVIITLLVGIRDYKLLVVSDLVGKVISLLFAIYYCKDIVFHNIKSFYFSISETAKNISVGIKLMFANIASMLILGVVRFGIERSWDVSTFGKVSLTLSVSNLMMLFINAVGIIMFPILRRTDKEKFPSLYILMRDFLMVLLLGVLIIYFPSKFILSQWLTSYKESLNYMALLFPMFVFEGKTALLINTFLKTLRKEKLMLKINLISLMLSLLISIITTLVLRNLDLAVLSIVILLAFRCVLAEIMLSKVLGISTHKNIFLELIVTLVFIVVGWFMNSLSGVVIYTITYILYLLIKRKDIIGTIKNIKVLMKV
ncbi:oligosaccharide flippase family protein [Schinkia azotoformans]|uniref:oligosaccharide flippase family protein n=1 Tax=Schinkia azotoformans TaxID=1454 RepID=UPI002DBFDADE|nr:oligosaccharide flippase family protein [Schinkia azotoformans]MEC1771910.1 oligosaccharide flippase family protein [Schinkia azotoformans]MED4366408.1 oligosaccharide flippase family protein [Schinkia azotoformans]